MRRLDILALIVGLIVAARVVYLLSEREEKTNLSERKEKINAESARHGETVKSLAKILQNEKAERQIRIDAAMRLGRIGGKEVVGPLKSVLTDKSIQVFVVYALKTVGRDASDALPDLVKLLRAQINDNKRGFERRELIDAIGSLGYGSQDAADVLALYLKEHRDYDAAKALAKLGPPGAEVLVSLAVKYSKNDRPSSERKHSEAYALLAAGYPLPKDLIPVFKKHLLKGGDAAIVAGLGFACVGAPAVPVLRELLEDKNANVRAYAAKALANMQFNVNAARAFRGEKIKDPFSQKEIYAKLKKLYKLSDNQVDIRIVDAMIGIDQDRCMSDPEIVEVLRKPLIESIKRDLEKKKNPSKP
jgi:HEAT repeat protein